MKQAIITFDLERIAQIDVQAEGAAFAWIIKQALLGKDYAAERGIASVKLIESGCILAVSRPEDSDEHTSFNLGEMLDLLKP